MTETRVKYNYLTHLANGTLSEFLQDEEERAHLELIANSYVVSGKKNYILARSIVLDIHITEEYYMNVIICLLFSAGCKKTDLKLNWETMVQGVGKIDYSKKLTIITEFSIFSPNSLEIMWKVNNLRRAFAHGHKDNSADYQYKGGSILERKTIDLLIGDHINNVAKEMGNLIKKFD